MEKIDSFFVLENNPDQNLRLSRGCSFPTKKNEVSVIIPTCHQYNDRKSCCK